MTTPLEAMRKQFEQWYVCSAFHYERDPLGSRDCGLQWKAWQAAIAALENTEPLTDEQINTLYNHTQGQFLREQDRKRVTDFVRAIEQEVRK